VVRAKQTDIEEAVAALRAGELVVFPTETVYGLGANAADADAVRRIFEVKGRPTDHPVIVHLDDARYLHRWVSDVPPVAEKLAAMFWPGPLTLILPKAGTVNDIRRASASACPRTPLRSNCSRHSAAASPRHPPTASVA
jgi:tRNA threonylcarbamoyl adenosine modification protein (Sua5/YciO/YrdC/YwlC family)